MSSTAPKIPPSPPPPPLTPLKGVGIENLENPNLKGKRAELLATLPPQQRRSAQTALARLATLGREGLIVNEWLAGRELKCRGELGRFDPARAFFFLFGKGCRGELMPIWAPALATSKQAEADAAGVTKKRKASEAKAAAQRGVRDAEIQRLAAALIADLGEKEVRGRVAKLPGGKLAKNGDIQNVAAILVAEEVSHA